VWFLGYYPQRYCSLFSCGWRFTYDEFEEARKAIGRMEAKVFQEENALQLLTDGAAAVDAAKADYQTAATTEDKLAAAAAWQSGMDMLNEIAPETLAGRMGQTKLAAYQRDFAQVSGLLAGGSRAATLITAAKEFAWTASLEAEKAPLCADSWARLAGLWQLAIARLEEVPVEDVGYAEAQRSLAEYQNKLGHVLEQQANEEQSEQALAAALEKNAALGGRVEYLSTAAYASELQSIVNDLNRVVEGTTDYAEAQTLLQAVQARLQEVASQPQS
ncbi:MAG TPA: hypothetical protein V6D02_16520, partial [Candidatus Obscuribacterales bacterium]